ncbi:hypothetical protein SAMN05444921_101133 [Streptomyces wuyuanensis]|uniref:Uncharacterized protein n=1 Tax=Streptomyces wuyuanensis TaxID=1196353 RepID=A0A1G9MJT2_9ACTN|nr:hypothetical protein SAMN05444921_101133 [Streptomyces wuyuanensis]
MLSHWPCKKARCRSSPVPVNSPELVHRFDATPVTARTPDRPPLPITEARTRLRPLVRHTSHLIR